MKMRLIMKTIFVLSLAILTAAAAPADEVDYQIFIKKQRISGDITAVNESNTTLLPAAPFFNAYHFKIKPQENTKLIIATDGYTKLEFEIGNTTAYLKGMNPYTEQGYGDDGLKVKLAVAPTIINDRIYLPVSLIAKSLGLHYQIDKQEKKIIFYSIPKKSA